LSNSGEDPLIATCERHSSGPVQGLDFNPFQHNLLASGGNDNEVGVNICNFMIYLSRSSSGIYKIPPCPLYIVLELKIKVNKIQALLVLPGIKKFNM
jgi:hypothetical protein